MSRHYICDKKNMILYGVTDNKWATDEYGLHVQIEDAIKGGATFIQLREKNLSTEEIVKKGKIIKEICNKYNVPFVIDDNIQAAILCGADGVHIGQSDISPVEVRKILGNDKIVGVTAKTVEQSLKAESEGASYIGTGAAFATSTKNDTYVIDHNVIKNICNSVKIPVVAIGGIDETNVEQLKNTGISGVAVVSGIFGKKNIKAAAENLKKIIMEKVI